MKKNIFFVIVLLMSISVSFAFNIVTSVKPLYLIIKGAIGNACKISYIMSPYTNPHTFQLKPSDILKFENANLIILVGRNFESWSEKVKEKFKDKVILLDETSLSFAIKSNPHFWLDPIYAGYFSDLIYRNLPSDIQNKAINSYVRFKISLIKESENILHLSKDVKNTHFIAVHPAFSYLIKRYGFEVKAVASGGKSSISSRELIELIKYSKKYHIKKIFAVEGLSVRLAKPLIDAAHLKLVTIDFLARNEENYLNYLNNIAIVLFGDNK